MIEANTTNLSAPKNLAIYESNYYDIASKCKGDLEDTAIQSVEEGGEMHFHYKKASCIPTFWGRIGHASQNLSDW